uniref:Uncharacterized protein n=1 Tax=Rhizophora mucronata TaxID=61149 RepID=A0A2P2NXG6_RHIMU
MDMNMVSNFRAWTLPVILQPLHFFFGSRHLFA